MRKRLDAQDRQTNYPPSVGPKASRGELALAAFYLVEMEGNSIKEAAADLGLSETNLRIAVSAGRGLPEGDSPGLMETAVQ